MVISFMGRRTRSGTVRRPGSVGLRGLRRAACGSGVAAVVGLSACGDEPATNDSTPVEVYGAGSLAVPVESLSDVVSYADQVSVVEVVSERDLSPPGGQNPEEDYVPREVTVVVGETLWRRPGAPASDDRFSMVAFGSVERPNERAPVGVVGGARLEVGESCLMALAQRKEGWGAYPMSTLELDGDRTVDEVGGQAPPPTVAPLAGKSLDEVADIVQAAKPDPLAVKYGDLPPAERWQAADRERESAGP